MKIHTKVVWDIASGEVLEDEFFEYDGPLVEAKGGGGGGGTTINKTEPWQGQKPYLRDVFEQAKQTYYNYTPKAYPGNTTVDYTPQEKTALENLWNYAGTQAPAFADAVTQANTFALGDILNPASNVALQQAAAGAISPVVEQLQQNILPGVQTEALQMGQYGGSRQQAATSQAIDKAVEDMLATTAKMYGDNDANSLDAFSKAMLTAPATQQLQTVPMQLQSAVGEAYRNYEQALLNDAIARWNYKQNLPYEKIAQYQTAVSGGFGGTSTVNRSGYSPSTGSRALGAIGGGVSGYLMGSQLAGSAAFAGTALAPVLGPIGAVLGLASAFF